MRKIALVIVLALSVVPAALAEQGSSATSPAKLCDAQRTAMGKAAFDQLYGTNANKSNAFGKCVSKLARAESQNTANAATACKAERADANFAAAHGGKTFEQFYGTGKNGKNAFGKCVSQKSSEAAQAQQEQTVNAARACRTEQRAGAAAFKAKYGTNKNKSNAFGKCVSQKVNA